MAGNLLTALWRGNRRGSKDCHENTQPICFCAPQYCHPCGVADSSIVLIGYFPNSYLFMRVSHDSHAPGLLPERGFKDYVAAQELRTLQRGLPDVPHMIRSDTMTTAALGFSTAPAQARSKSGRSFFARLYAALVEARMRAAMREI